VDLTSSISTDKPSPEASRIRENLRNCETAKRQPPNANRQTPTAKRQTPNAKRQTHLEETACKPARNKESAAQL
jgi:hypothetical protein